MTAEHPTPKVWVSQGKRQLDLSGLVIVEFTPRTPKTPPHLSLQWKDGTSWSTQGMEALSLRQTIRQVYPHL